MTLSRTRPMKPRTKPLKRVAVKTRNAKRRKRLFAEDFHSAEYVAHIKAMACALCGVGGYSEAAHVRSRGAGGKASDLVPLCGRRGMTWRGKRWVLYGGCHEAFDLHALDEPKQRDELKARAAELWSAWQAHLKGAPDDSPG